MTNIVAAPVPVPGGVFNEPEFDALSSIAVEDDLALAQKRRGIANLLESYHGRLDGLIEAVQNAVDAIESRWQSWRGPDDSEFLRNDDELPFLQLVINTDLRTLEIIDNGIGIEAGSFRHVFAPHFSLKDGSSAKRGHKGVGATFLSFGHERFEFHTKTKHYSTAYAISGGRAWAIGKANSDAPKFSRLDGVSDALNPFVSGSHQVIDYGNNHPRDPFKAYHNTVKMWASVLRSFTAIGYLSPGVAESDLPIWVKYIKVQVKFIKESTTESAEVEFKFLYPHELFPVARRKELQVLQNEGRHNEHNLNIIYLNRDYRGLIQLLGEDVNQPIEEDSEKSVADFLSKYEVSVYASYGNNNSIYEEEIAKYIGTNSNKFSYRNIRGGVLVSSVNMPMGDTFDHLNPMRQPEDRRRYFLAVDFNQDLKPDLGRKSIGPQEKLLIRWLEDKILNLLDSWDSQLIVTHDDAPGRTRSVAEANRELRSAEGEIRNFQKDLFDDAILLPLKRAAVYENEVIAHFVALIQGGFLPGYEIDAISGGRMRYDGSITYTAEAPEEVSVETPIPLGIDKSHFKKNKNYAASGWLEFKVKLDYLYPELTARDDAPKKKYLEHLDLIVAWDVDDYSYRRLKLVKIDETNWLRRRYYGSTHFLVQDDLQVDVIILSDLMGRLFD